MLERDAYARGGVMRADSCRFRRYHTMMMPMISHGAAATIDTPPCATLILHIRRRFAIYYAATLRIIFRLRYLLRYALPHCRGSSTPPPCCYAVLIDY